MLHQTNNSQSHTSGGPMMMFYVKSDVLGPIELRVTGHIPAYCAGTLYCTGPCANKVKDTVASDFNLNHWFNGFAQAHRFELSPDSLSPSRMKVEYNSRRSVDPLIEKIRATGRYDQVTFGQKRDPCDGLFKKFRSAFQVLREPAAGFNNIAVTIAPDVPGMRVGQSGQEAVLTPPNHSANAAAEESKKRKTSRFKTLTAFIDTSGFKYQDPETLKPLGVASQSPLHPSLTGPFSAAHANFNPKTGDVYNHNCDFTLPLPTYRIWKTDKKTEKTEIIATIKMLMQLAHTFTAAS